MSNDLISRSALLESVNYYYTHTPNDSPEHYAYGVALKEIREHPTAFDKEKVIEELVELRQREYNDSDEESETMDGEEIYDKGRSQGRFEAYHRTIGIVEKGGIE